MIDKVWIPLTKSIITAVLVALFVASWGIGSIFWKMFGMVLSGVCLVCWLILILPKSKPVNLTRKETTVKLHLASDNGRRLQFADLPVSHDLLREFAQGVLDGASLTEARWCGNGRPFSSRSEFVALRDELIQRRLAAWNNPTCTARGWGLTRSGLAAFRYLSEPPTPTNGKEAKIRSVV